MIHVSVTIEKVSLQGRPWFFLPFPSHSSFILIISVTVVPERVQWISNIKNFHTRVISVVAPIFEHNCAYQDDPCGSQGPKHTQQKSDLQDWFLHTIWLQPPSFSIVAPEIKDKMFIQNRSEHRDLEYLVNIQATITKGTGHTAFWTFLGVGGDPVWRFWIIIAFLNPLFNKMTPHRIMPSFWTCETKEVATSETLKTSLVWILSKNYIYN